MRQFLYGRYDVLRGARGYEIFAADRGLSRELIRKLTPCFSTEDPNFNILQTLGEFFVYFPTDQGDWVFGKGNVEERGDYFYYMLHAVVLTENERRALGYNPFSMAHLLNPLVGERRELPELPNAPLSHYRKDAMASLRRVFGKMAEDRDAMRALAIGLILDRLLRLKAKRDGSPLTYHYHPNLDASVWLAIFEFLPVDWRRRLSLSSLDSFLKLATHIQGRTQGGNREGSKGTPLDMVPPEATPFGHFLQDLGLVDESVQRQRLQMVLALRDDASEESLSAAVYADHLGAISRAVMRPSIRTMQRWQAIAAGRRLFAWKAHFLGQIWERHAEERHYFPNLATSVVATVKADFERLQPNLSEQDGNQLRGILDRFILQVDGLANRELMLMVLGSPSLAADYFPKVDDEAMVAAIWRESLDLVTFTKLLANRIQWKDSWSEALDGLWLHPFTAQLPTAVLARIFDMLLTWKTRFAIGTILEKRFLDDPDSFQAFLDRLNHGPQMLSRFVVILGRMLAWSSPERTPAVRSLLRICYRKEPTRFLTIAASWIGHRASEYMLPKLAGDPELAPALLDAWQPAAENDLAKLRLLYFARLMQPNAHPYDLPSPQLVNLLKGNAMFECLLEV